MARDTKDRGPQWPVSLAGLPRRGRRIDIRADAGERQRIAREYGLTAVDRFEAEVTLSPWAGSGVKVEGRIRADVVQACVVTLEPVAERIDEAFVRRFLDEREHAGHGADALAREIEVAVDEEDPAEPIGGVTLALGPVLLEQFALALNPYPRSAKAGEGAGDTATGKATGDAEQDSPFAVLKALKPGGADTA